jgi:hypothetical protein
MWSNMHSGSQQQVEASGQLHCGYFTFGEIAAATQLAEDWVIPRLVKVLEREKWVCLQGMKPRLCWLWFS